MMDTNDRTGTKGMGGIENKDRNILDAYDRDAHNVNGEQKRRLLTQPWPDACEHVS